MNSFSAVSHLGRAWIAMYTAGLPEDVRERRRGEIESDLHEHVRAAAVAGRGPDEVAAPVAGRFVRGMPADIAWRVEHELSSQHEDDVAASWGGRIVALFLLAMAGWSLYWVFRHAFFGDAEHRFWAVLQVVSLVGTLLLFKGFALSRRAPWSGAGLVALGCALIGFVWIWLFWTLLPIAGVLVYGLVRSWRFSRDDRARLRAPIDEDPP